MSLLLLLLSCSPDATRTCKFATSCLFFKLHHSNFVKHCVERLFLPLCVGMRAHGLVKHVLLALVALLLVPHGGTVEGKKREKNSKRVSSKTYSSTGTSTVNGGGIKRNGVPPPPPPPPPPSGIARNRRRAKVHRLGQHQAQTVTTQTLLKDLSRLHLLLSSLKKVLPVYQWFRR